jgi:hypothetical protein
LSGPRLTGISVPCVNLLTSAVRHPGYPSVAARTGVEMEDRFDIVTIGSAVFVAGYAAMALRYVALYDLGLSRHEVCSGATIVAVLMAALVAIDFLRSKPGNT